jgi:GR25 family glycosyltransferase involved in LPS biosynthesis
VNQPRCYIIAHSTSRVIQDCVASLRQNNWNFEIFPAVDGHQVSKQTWQDIGVEVSQEGKMSRRPGAQGCWMSHWQLWNRCVQSQESVVILEHDAVVTGPWPVDLDIDTHLVKLYTQAECKVNPAFGRWSKGAHAYTLTPSQAQQLIAYAKNNGAQAADKHLGDLVLPWTFYTKDLVVLNPKRGPSSTSKISFQTTTTT